MNTAPRQIQTPKRGKESKQGRVGWYKYYASILARRKLVSLSVVPHMRRRLREHLYLPTVLGVLVVLAPSLTAQQRDLAASAFFLKNIQPVLEQKCFNCHKPESNVSKLDLTTRAALMEGGDNGPAVVPGKPARSLLYRSITHQSQPFMPMGMERLPQDVVDNFAAWIEAGAHYAETSTTANRKDERWLKGQ